jgi:hypothetical protein
MFLILEPMIIRSGTITEAVGQDYHLKSVDTVPTVLYMLLIQFGTSGQDSRFGQTSHK